MKLTHRWLAALIAMTVSIALTGCSGAVFGHVAVLAVTVGIFFGTLSLNRRVTAETPAQDAAQDLPEEEEVSAFHLVARSVG